jgi:ribose 5-phosphate isomerase A
MSADLAKKNAGEAAVDFIKDGMIVGLGTGSTAAYFVRALAARKLKIRGVPTSNATAALATELGIALITPNEAGEIDVTVDGADEIDGAFRLIKGGGGALLREKIVAAASKRMIVIADDGKMVATLGKFPLPVEVTQFAYGLTERKVLKALAIGKARAAHAVLRKGAGGAPFVTDGGNYILDCPCEAIGDADALAPALAVIPGVVEHGLFIGMADTVILGKADGVEIRKK